MHEDKIRPKRIINKRNLLIFLVSFIVGYCLLNYAYKAILEISFSDLFEAARNEGYRNILRDRLYGLMSWEFGEPFILLIILSLTCVYTKIFKQNYFKESVIALLIFITALFSFVFLGKLYTQEREKSNQIIYKKLIIGKWHYTNRSVGNVIIVFNKDSTGYRFNDSGKIVQKFEYVIEKGILVVDYQPPKFFQSKQFEFYWIDSLTTKTLSIRVTRKNIIKHNVYDSKYTRGLP